MNFYYEKMLCLGADGIDFVPFGFEELGGTVYASFLKEAFEDEKNVPSTPRTPYLFWRWDNGVKQYIYSTPITGVDTIKETRYDKLIKMSIDDIAEKFIIKLPYTLSTPIYVSAFDRTVHLTKDDCFEHNRGYLNEVEE